MNFMRMLFIFIFIFSHCVIDAQDKIYLKDQTVIPCKIEVVTDTEVHVLLPDNSSSIIPNHSIAILIYSNGQSEMVKSPIKKEKKKEYELSDWMIGMNILLPVDRMFGFQIDRKIGKNYSMRFSEAFLLTRNYGFEATSSLLNNIYIGKGRAKWINSIGINLIYSEGRYYSFDGLMPMIYDSFAPYPPAGFHPNLDLELTFGTGIHVDIAKHLSFSAQVMFAYDFGPHYNYFDVDMYNSGFSFYYKF